MPAPLRLNFSESVLAPLLPYQDLSISYYRKEFQIQRGYSGVRHEFSVKTVPQRFDFSDERCKFSVDDFSSATDSA